MSIIKSIDNAYRKMRERGYDTIYWCIDLHGTCFESNYKNGEYTWISDFAPEALLKISDQPESVIILWSGAYPEEQTKIIEFFRSHGIYVDYFNENPRESSTETGDFSKKFYFSILIDDKAGFDPEDWYDINRYFE